MGQPKMPGNTALTACMLGLVLLIRLTHATQGAVYTFERQFAWRRFCNDTNT